MLNTYYNCWRRGFHLIFCLVVILVLTRAELDTEKLTEVKENIAATMRKLVQLQQSLETLNQNITSTEEHVLRLIERDAWLAQPPSRPPLSLHLPVSRVIVMPTKTEDCTTQAACTFRVRYIQTFNIESLQHDDIIYNFLIGGDGSVYEGRGWSHMGAHLKDYNENSISFAYIGTFKKQKPTAKQLNATKLLLEEGLKFGKLSQNYKIYSAYELDSTSIATSAEALYESFKDWPQWSGN